MTSPSAAEHHSGATRAVEDNPSAEGAGAPPHKAEADGVTGGADGATGEGEGVAGEGDDKTDEATSPGGGAGSVTSDGAGDSPPPVGVPRRQVRILDLPITRVRRPSDLVQLLLSAVGIALVLILSVYAYGTTTGVTRDVQSALDPLIRSVLLVPVNVIEGLLTLILPVLVIVAQLMRRNVRGVGEAVAASAAAFLLASLVVVLLSEFGAGTEIAHVLLRLRDGAWVITITPTVAALAGLLTAVGTRGRRRVVATSWNLLWISLGLSVITGDTTLVGAVVAVLIGRIAGLGMRYASGVLSERAHGTAMVDGIRRAGVEPLAVIRVGNATQDAALQPQTATIPISSGYSTTSPRAGGAVGGTNQELPQTIPAVSGADASTPATTETSAATKTPGTETAVSAHRAARGVPASATVATERAGQNRVYAVIAADGSRWDAVLLDGDRQVIGLLASFWSVLRLRGLERRAAVSLKQAAERAALMYYAATAAGVNSPGLHGIAEADDSVLLIGEHIQGARSVGSIEPAEITEEVMAQVWEQLLIAHGAGLAHRNISAETVLLALSGPRSGEVWLNGWEQGEIASSALARRVDRAQLLTAFALHVGADRAVAAARRVLEADQLAEIAPLLQPVAFPPETRAAARSNRETLATLRSAMLEFIPTGGEIQPIRLSRFSARTVLTLTIAVIAVWVLVTTMNFAQVREVVADANPAWMIVAFGFGLLTYLGGAIGLVAFSPERLGLWRTTLVQVAASVITLVAPAGVGPAALNLRFMQRKGVKTSMALATVTLLQLSQFVTTVLLVIAVALLSGSTGAWQQLPSLAIVVTLALVTAIAGIVLLVPAVRAWLVRRALPTWRQVWPRVVWVFGQPRRLLLGIAGNLLMTIGFIVAFGAALQALGQTLPLTTLVIVFLTGNTVGSAIPTPGGIGTVELALSTTLRTAGIATAAAASSAVLFRLLTFWIRVPLGWVALRYLQRKEAL